MARVWVQMKTKMPGMKKTGKIWKTYFNSWHAGEHISNMSAKRPIRILKIQAHRPAGLKEFGRNMFRPHHG
jgi:hypothetical protein